MNTLFILLCLASMIAIPVYLIKFLLKVVKKTDRSQPKKRLLIALAVFVISMAGGIATTPSTPSTPAEPPAIADTAQTTDDDRTPSNARSSEPSSALNEPSADPAAEPVSALSESSAQPSSALPGPDADEPAAALPSEPSDQAADTPAAPASVQPAAAPIDPPAAPAESPQPPAAAPVQQAAPAPEPAAAKITASYVGNANTKKFHYASCSSAKQIKASNRVEFDSAEEAENAGYVPCKRCNP